MNRMFESLSVYNYRVWFFGALFSNIGIWMQRIGQDWVVLTELTDHDAIALSWMTALQFLPLLILMPITGMVSDRFDKRTVLIVTQSVQGALAVGLALLMFFGHAELWHMYVAAGGLGLVTAFSQPARQTIVGELVEDRALPNAVALNVTSLLGARLTGPALSGLTIAAVGAGWAFAMSAAAAGGMLVSLAALHKDQIRKQLGVPMRPSDFLRGFAYVGRRADLRALFAMIAILGLMLGNFTLVLTTLTAVTFSAGAFDLGLAMTGSAIGGIVASLLIARSPSPRWRHFAIGAFLYATTWVTVVAMPELWLFLLLMPFTGFASQWFLISANTYLQLTTAPAMRGRVMALFEGVLAGTSPFGAVVLGWIIAALGPAWAVGIGAGFVGVTAGLIALLFVAWTSRILIRAARGPLRLTVMLEPRKPRGAAL